jgi:[protein-PII] uridylyltransferase
LNILSAQIFSRQDGIVLDTFYVTEVHGGGMVARESRERFEEMLLKALTRGPLDFHSLIARQKVARPLYQGLPGQRIKTRILFDNATSEDRTVIDVETEDHLGLLYAISDVLTKLGLDIALAKISTEKGAAVDTFYVRDSDGLKVESAERQREIAESLYEALKALERAVP